MTWTSSQLTLTPPIPTSTVVPEATGAPTEWDDHLIDLYRNEYRSLCRCAQRMLHSPDLAEEVVQEAFVKYQQTKLPAAPGKEAAYVRSIVLNLARSRVRARMTARRYDPLIGAARHREPLEWLDHYGVGVVRRAVERLPLRQREAIVYRIFLDFSEQETADRMEVSCGAVKTHLSRARTSLRSALQPLNAMSA